VKDFLNRGDPEFGEREEMDAILTGNIWKQVGLQASASKRRLVAVVIQPKVVRKSGIPILIEAKSAGDFTNTNKRRKEESTKVHQLRAAYGDDAKLILFLCGYFDGGFWAVPITGMTSAMIFVSGPTTSWKS
jgi:hypothetical protein